MTDETTTLEAGFFTLDEDARTARGLLLPWDEQTRADAAKQFTFPRGSVTIPGDISILRANREHNPVDPVATFAAVEETDQGIVATFSIAKTPEGDEFIQQKRDGKLTKLSAEMRNIVHRGATVISSTLSGAAFVSEPAFASAALFSLNAVVSEPVETETPKEPTDSVTPPAPTTTETPEAPAEKEPAMGIPNTAGSAAAQPTVDTISKAEVFSILASKANNTATPEMLARVSAADAVTTSEAGLFSLTNVKHGVGVSGAVVAYNPAPAWIGEIWDGVTAKPVISDLIGSKTLTARQVSGFKFTTKPTGGDWAGNGAAITSSAIATTPYTYTASYWAGGNSFSREHLDFGVSEELLSSYFEMQTENFIAWEDAKVLDAITSAATAVTADNPSGQAIGAGLSALIDGYTEVVAQNVGTPTFALVEASLYKSIVKIPQSDVLGYLNAALGLEEGSISGFSIRPVPASSDIPTGHILIGVRQGADLYTLPGSPIRAQALEVGVGLIDVGLYGYALPIVNKASAFALVAPYSGS